MGAARVNVRLSSVISASGETGTGSKHAPNRAIFTEKNIRFSLLGKAMTLIN